MNNNAALLHRVEAMELFLQQLVFLLEVERNLTTDNMAAWMVKFQALQRRHKVTPEPVLDALGSLMGRAFAQQGLPFQTTSDVG